MRISKHPLVCIFIATLSVLPEIHFMCTLPHHICDVSGKTLLLVFYITNVMGQIHMKWSCNTLPFCLVCVKGGFVYPASCKMTSNS